MWVVVVVTKSYVKNFGIDWGLLIIDNLEARRLAALAKENKYHGVCQKRICQGNLDYTELSEEASGNWASRSDHQLICWNNNLKYFNRLINFLSLSRS